MANPNRDAGPVVPSGPTVQASAANEPKVESASTPSDERRATSDDKRPGGRRPYEEILEENKVLARRVGELLAALQPFAGVPIDPRAEPDRPQYALTKGGPAVLITAAHVTAARRAVGMTG